MPAEPPLILIADDEESFAIPLRDNLVLEGYRVQIATDGDAAVEAVCALHPDLLLLDITMPGKDGYEVCREIQRLGIATPIMFLSARDQEIDVVLGLELGADDYVTKPFRLRELTARIKAILRRQARIQSESPTVGAVEVGVATVDFRRYEVFRRGQAATLTPREFAVLHYLLERQGEVVGREELLKEVWGYERLITTRTVDNHVARIRKVIEAEPARPRHLLSVRSVGYRLVVV